MKGPIAYSVAVLSVTALFLLAPGLDLAVTGLFYQPPLGFPLSAWWPVHFIEQAIPWITRLIVAVALLGTGWLVFAGRPLWRLDRKALTFIVVATALGPGLLVNTVLKDHWGRARPYQTTQFGGAHRFTPAPLPATECDHNCAFVSGHAALGFSLVGFAFLLTAGRRRDAAIAAALAFGAVVGLARIAAGGHFLSDVIFAGLIVYAASWTLHRWIVVHDALGSPPATRGYKWLGARLAIGRLPADIPVAPLSIWFICAFVVEAVSIGWLDRPIANFFHTDAAALHPFFHFVERFGFGWPYLVVFGSAFAVLRWGGSTQGLRPWATSMQRMAWLPAFLFAVVAASGLAVDLLKVLFGRTRPKLLFADGLYDFSWLGLRADHWSFPSGHAATAAAVMAAFWCLWPRPILLYGVLAALVALSRIVTGAHYLSDTVMGAFIGVLTARLIAAWFARGRLPALLSRSVVVPAMPQP